MIDLGLICPDRILCLALSLAAAPALAAPVYDASGIAAPCLAASPDVDGFRAAFEAAGWAEVQGAARTHALWALGEVNYMITRSPKMRDRDDYADFREYSHKVAERDRYWMLVMARKGIAAGVILLDLDPGETSVSCYVTGPKMPEVAVAMAQPDAHLPDPDREMFAAIGSFFESPDLPGYNDLRYDWITIEPPFLAFPPLLGAQSIIVTYQFDTANPPEPPPPAPPGGNVRKDR